LHLEAADEQREQEDIEGKKQLASIGFILESFDSNGGHENGCTHVH